MSADVLLSRLDSVRSAGPSRWMARCPSHQDKRASLSIRETDDGTVLINDFGGCGATDVLAAVGLEFGALFPAQVRHRTAIRNPVFKSEVFDLIRFERSIVHLIGCDMRKGKQISEQDYQRLGESLAKLERIKEAAYGYR
jgi:hypothetical protein